MNAQLLPALDDPERYGSHGRKTQPYPSRAMAARALCHRASKWSPFVVPPESTIVPLTPLQVLSDLYSQAKCSEVQHAAERPFEFSSTSPTLMVHCNADTLRKPLLELLLDLRRPVLSIVPAILSCDDRTIWCSAKRSPYDVLVLRTD